MNSFNSSFVHTEVAVHTQICNNGSQFISFSCSVSNFASCFTLGITLAWPTTEAPVIRVLPLILPLSLRQTNYFKDTGPPAPFITAPGTKPDVLKEFLPQAHASGAIWWDTLFVFQRIKFTHATLGSLSNSPLILTMGDIAYPRLHALKLIIPQSRQAETSCPPQKSACSSETKLTRAQLYQGNKTVCGCPTSSCTNIPTETPLKEPIR